MNRLRQWWSRLTKPAKAVIGVGVPLVLVAALIARSRAQAAAAEAAQAGTTEEDETAITGAVGVSPGLSLPDAGLTGAASIDNVADLRQGITDLSMSLADRIAAQDAELAFLNQETSNRISQISTNLMDELAGVRTDLAETRADLTAQPAPETTSSPAPTESDDGRPPTLTTTMQPPSSPGVVRPVVDNLKKEWVVDFGTRTRRHLPPEHRAAAIAKYGTPISRKTQLPGKFPAWQDYFWTKILGLSPISDISLDVRGGFSVGPPWRP